MFYGVVVLLMHIFIFPNIEHDGYLVFKKGTIDFDEVIDRLCSMGTQWKVSLDRSSSFPSSGLCKEYKGWNYFISARMLLVTHTSNVVQEKALLRCIIVTWMTVDVGRVFR